MSPDAWYWDLLIGLGVIAAVTFVWFRSEIANAADEQPPAVIHNLDWYRDRDQSAALRAGCPRRGGAHRDRGRDVSPIRRSGDSGQHRTDSGDAA